MVYIKEIELTNFKSFGGTTRVPFRREFTVISGPNGSGKSNILDALLFCLGIASSKGMRADRLPDLVNQQQNKRRSTVEASVSVTFDLSPEDRLWGRVQANETADETSDEPSDENPDIQISETEEIPQHRDWRVTRRLRVTRSGGYTSQYAINGEVCTLGELHEQLNELRVYPEGYNVVLQGDVTSIISMNARERREIIDELAGVAAFDRKIDRAQEKFAEVEEREDRCRIVEKELTTQRDRLAADRLKAEQYQRLRQELQEKQAWARVLQWQQLRQRQEQIGEQLAAGDRTRRELQETLAQLTENLKQASDELDILNQQVKALGEEELLARQSELARQEAEQQQRQQRREELQQHGQELERAIAQTETAIAQSQQQQEQLRQQQQLLETDQLPTRRESRELAQGELERARESANALADRAQAWVQEQTQLRQQTETLLGTLEPQRTEQAQLRERLAQLGEQLSQRETAIAQREEQLHESQQEYEQLQEAETKAQEHLQQLERTSQAAEEELQIQQDTQTRLQQEQRDKQRRLDKLEAQNQALQEASGSYASQVVEQSGLSGICGLVSQLGRVESDVQIALETAAGGRLGFVVVEDDLVASAAIQLLKEKRAGRATFLPLNKIHAPRFQRAPEVERSPGFVDYAVNLIDCEERYDSIFAYVFGSTVVFDSLDNARRLLGQARMVTLDGELLEASGAMTGGSQRRGASHLHFGNVDSGESAEVKGLRDRLRQIGEILERCEGEILRWSSELKLGAKALMEAKQQHRELQLRRERLGQDIESLQQQQEQGRSQQQQQRQELDRTQARFQQLQQELPQQEQQLQGLRDQLAELEKSQTHQEWQQYQQEIQQREEILAQRTQSLREAEERLRELVRQQERLTEKTQERQQQLGELQHRRQEIEQQQQQLAQHLEELEEQIAQTRASFAEIEAKLGEEKQARDRAEARLRELRVSQQQTDWRLQKLQETQEGRVEQLQQVRDQLREQEQELPNPLPEVPPQHKLDTLDKELRSLAKRIEAMEPVNMLALEEFERTQARLEELSEKLAILQDERQELLLRIENFTTLRLRAFKEAFDAVNENFAQIFAELSEGDGHLQLSDPEDPFNGGLNLVAHPKGKPVQRLASMSGGEKSLTALSFIFALQRYRPSPFYAFDEVDMFLDGANVERLAKMIKKQAQAAQFIVVSLRRPTIAAAARTIGVTQARGAYTQVLGLTLQQQPSTDTQESLSPERSV
ncbi:chromosome segregation protein SMC [Phormidium yuhuli AB48]|uniref:Chromosome partition protein Smc n=1 Tax=Phormidium yuhuli AB48 TaxID=2940671 RepID=A0ABY5AK99_9CYAN|nr:chromosome segregation protein SMC [Phormidium yuhuli]USR89614.1 chromosome segregation protein SMC [Phormidium yuhuli AB48]